MYCVSYSPACYLHWLLHTLVCPPHPRKQANSRQFMIADMLSSTCCGHLCTYLWPILALSVLCRSNPPSLHQQLIIWLFFSSSFRYICTYENIVGKFMYGETDILLPKLFWTAVRKNCSSDWGKLLKFKAEGREFAKILRSLEQFIQTVKGQINFW